MAYYINDDCISCGACEPECPVSCISAGDTKYVIDPDVCIDCGLMQVFALLMLQILQSSIWDCNIIMILQNK